MKELLDSKLALVREEVDGNLCGGQEREFALVRLCFNLALCLHVFFWPIHPVPSLMELEEVEKDLWWFGM